MESIRLNPETYSRAVACFVEVWKSMDDKDRLVWLQTKIEDNVAQRVMLVTAEQFDETIEAADNIDFIQFAEQHSYSDVMDSNSQEVTLEASPSKRMKLDTASATVPLGDFSLCHFPE